MFYIGIYGSKEEYPYFLKHFETLYDAKECDKHILGIERHKYSLKLNESIMDIEEITKALMNL